MLGVFFPFWGGGDLQGEPIDDFSVGTGLGAFDQGQILQVEDLASKQEQPIVSLLLRLGADHQLLPRGSFVFVRNDKFDCPVLRIAQN